MADLENALGEARRCDCGGVNLTMGALSLHLAAGEVEELYELVAGARQLVGPEAAHGRKRRPRAHGARLH